MKTAKTAKSGKTKGDVDMNIKRGDIYYADLSPVVGSEQGGLRPVLIVQNDVGNRYSPTVIAAAITSKMGKARLPTHIDIYAKEVGLAKDSVILLEQVRTLDKRRLREKMGHLEADTMQRVNTAISVSFGLVGNDDRDGRVYTARKIEENNT
jgi:mRNA interferase MazF